MQIELIQRADGTLGIQGEMTVYYVSALRDSLCEALKKTDHLRLNLSDVSAIDITGFQLLMALKVQTKKEGKRLSLHSHNDYILRILDLTGTAAFFGDKIVLGAGKRSEYPFRYGTGKPEKS